MLLTLILCTVGVIFALLRMRRDQQRATAARIDLPLDRASQ